MANTKISALTDGATASATDKIPVERSGANRYVTPGYIRTHILGQANTFTGNQTVSGGSLILSGNISAAAWTTNGIRFRGVAATLTDETSSGTVAAAYTNAYGGNTIAASSATTFTNYYTTFITEPNAGSNVTFTNRHALGLGGSLAFSGDVVLTRDAANVLAQRNSTNAQTFRIYNTYSSDSNYERGFLRWNSNVFEIGTESQTGSNRALSLVSATGATKFGAADAASPSAQTISVQNVVAGTTNTAGANLTILGSAGTGTGAGGSIIFRTANAGSSGSSQNSYVTALTLAEGSPYSGQWTVGSSASTFSAVYGSNQRMNSGSVLTWSSVTNAPGSGTADIGFSRAAAGILRITNGSTGGGSIEMGEVTAPSAPASNNVRIYAEDNGAGKTRLMALFPTGAAQQIAIEP